MSEQQHSHYYRQETMVAAANKAGYNYFCTAKEASILFECIAMISRQVPTEG
jgi:hypothetical protein